MKNYRGSAVLGGVLGSVVVLLVAWLVPLAVWAQSGLLQPLFTIEVKNQTNIARPRAFVSGGIPFAQGQLPALSRLRILDNQGNLVPHQARMLSMAWPDGSLKWVEILVHAGLQAQEIKTYSVAVAAIDGAPVAPPPLGLGVTQNADLVTLENNKMRFQFVKDPSRFAAVFPGQSLPACNGLFLPGYFSEKTSNNQIKPILVNGMCLTLSGDREAMTAGDFLKSGRSIPDLNHFGLRDRGAIAFNKLTTGHVYSTLFRRPVSVVVEESGPLRVVLKIIPQGLNAIEGSLGYFARITAYADRAALEFEITLQNFEDSIFVGNNNCAVENACASINNKKYIRNYILDLSLNRFLASGLSEIRSTVGDIKSENYIFENITGSQTSTPPTAFSFLQIGDSQALQQSQQRLTHGAGALGLINAEGSRLNVVSKYFFETFPKGIRFDQTRSNLTLQFDDSAWSAIDQKYAGYHFGPGRWRTESFVVALNESLEDSVVEFKNRIRPKVSPLHYNTSKADLPVLSGINKSSLQKFVSQRYFQNISAAFDNKMSSSAPLYGAIDFGDHHSWSSAQRLNGNHDMAVEYFRYYLVTHEYKYLHMASAAARHRLQVDTQHWGRLLGSRENWYGRAVDHLSLAAEKGEIYMWAGGELMDYLLTGDRLVFDGMQSYLARYQRALAMYPGRHTMIPFLNITKFISVFGASESLSNVFGLKFHSARLEDERTRDRFPRDQLEVITRSMQQAAEYLYRECFDGACEGGFISSYLQEGFYHYYQLTGQERFREAVATLVRRLFLEQTLPTGLVSNAIGAENAEKYVILLDEVLIGAALATLLMNDVSYLDYAKPTLDFIFELRQQPVVLRGMSREIPVVLGVLEHFQQSYIAWREPARWRIPGGSKWLAEVERARVGMFDRATAPYFAGYAASINLTQYRLGLLDHAQQFFQQIEVPLRDVQGGSYSTRLRGLLFP